MEVPKVIYWNAEHGSLNGQKTRYIKAIMDTYEPDCMIVSECPEKAVVDIEHACGFVDFEPSITRRSSKEGIAVIARQEVNVERDFPWKCVKSRRFSYHDHQQLVRLQLGDIALYTGHLSDYFTLPRLSARRADEWLILADIVKEYRDAEMLMMLDTNTVRDTVVIHKLGLRTSGAELLNPLGTHTWGLKIGELQLPRVFGLDRVIATAPLAGRVAMSVIPDMVNGIRNPSDHLAIVALPSDAT